LQKERCLAAAYLETLLIEEETIVSTYPHEVGRSVLKGDTGNIRYVVLPILLLFFIKHLYVIGV
jgi:hypothetical protein